MRQACEPARDHSHREVCPLHVARGNVFGVRIAASRRRNASEALGWAVAALEKAVREPGPLMQQANHFTFRDNENSARRDSGGRAAIRFKTFEMDRKAFQGEAVDEVHLDEDSGDDTVYGECLARLAATPRTRRSGAYCGAISPAKAAA